MFLRRANGARERARIVDPQFSRAHFEADSLYREIIQPSSGTSQTPAGAEASYAK